MEYDYYIEKIEGNILLIIVLTTELTSTYWTDLVRTINSYNLCEMDIYFDFLYRNGFNNRFFKGVIQEKKIYSLKRCECEYSYVADRFFSKNLCLLEGSVLSSEQKKKYIKKIVCQK